MTTMYTFEEKQADNLDDAWSNFDPNFPLEAGSPFFVQRDEDPLGSLKRALLRRQRMPQKRYIAGFKGAGKSTHINQLAADPELTEKFFVVKFSIKETCDERNINYVDLLTAIAAKVFETYTKSGGKLSKALIDEVEAWGRKVTERINSRGAELQVEAQAGGGFNIGLFFAKLTAKSKAEASSRTIIREVLEPQLTDLLDKINLISGDILVKTKKEVLVFVDDTDKPFPEQATRLFKDHLSALLAPDMNLVYTVPVWMCFTDEFPELRGQDVSLLPNVKLYDKANPTRIDLQGKATMERFISARMKPSLMDADATELAIVNSGGVFREAARILQMSVDRALEDRREVVRLSDVENALQDLRRSFRRLITELSTEELDTLRAIGESRSYEGSERMGRFLNNLLVLEYADDEKDGETGDNWPYLNPLLRDVIT